MNTLFKSPEGQKAILSLYNRALSQWPVRYSEHTVPTRYGETAYIECGNKSNPALLLLHGSSSNATSWIGEIPSYSRYFRVIIPDVIGEPGKSAETRPPYETDDYAHWLNEVVRKIGVDRVSVVGLSQGGWIAAKYAITYPEKIDKLVLLAAAGFVPTKISFLMTAILLSMLGRRGTDRLNKYVWGNKPMDASTLEYLNAIMNNFTPRFSKEYIFLDRELKRLTMPVMYIGGTDDVIRDNGKIGTRLEKLLPHLEMVILPETGHVLINTSDRVVSFLRG